ncbi:MAG: hypothetical protein WAW67_03420 [Candidatus Omnitrophota bacterium]
MKGIILALLLLGIAWNAFAEPGPPIPKPNISLSEASQLAKDYFAANMKEDKYFKIEDYFVIFGEYKYFGDIYKRTEGWSADGSNNKEYLEKAKDYWAWEIRIIHPIANDISITYKITNSKQIIELERTN